MEALPGEIMVEAGAAAGPAQDVRHQHRGTKVSIHYNYGINHNDAACIVVTADQWYALDPGFEPRTKQRFVLYVHRHMTLYIQCIYLVHCMNKI